MTSKTATRKPAKTTIRVYPTDEQPMPITPITDAPTPALRAAQHAFAEAMLNGGSARPESTFGPAEAPAVTPATVTPAAPVLTVKQERDALKAAGAKRCPTHLKLLDRLPDAAKQLVSGYEDVSIRPLTEYQKRTSTCRACDHLIQRDWRAAHRQPGAGARNSEATLARLVAQRDALTARIAALEAVTVAATVASDGTVSDAADRITNPRTPSA